jgi:hypothetical protein
VSRVIGLRLIAKTDFVYPVNKMSFAPLASEHRIIPGKDLGLSISSG